MSLTALKTELRSYINPEKARFLPTFFKAGPGGYAQGDQFIGVTVPNTRTVAKHYKTLDLVDVTKLLHSPIHEERLCALFILIHQFDSGTSTDKKTIVDLYLANTNYINNWDLVDASAHKILGVYLADKSRDILYTLIASESLWERRIAIIATYHFIAKQGEYADAFSLCEAVLNDTEDLIHKASGWMLREVGKRISQEVEEQFLQQHCKTMPRTMLRYAIEHFSKDKKEYYMNGGDVHV